MCLQIAVPPRLKAEMYGNGKLYGIILIYSSLSRIVCGEKSDNGCGHSIQGPDSGVLSSRQYPGTYPNNSFCEWRIRLPEGSASITIKFADLSIESRGCESDYIRILQGSGRSEQVLGPFCGDLKSAPSLLKPLRVDGSEIRVQFRSGQHISGRGFLLSYASGNHKDLLTCLDKGNHFSDAKYRKYCPAGCRAVAGDVSGDVSQGYRHTSVLCKAAVHAGVISDELGGVISVEERSGQSHYPAVRANKIQSKDGSLSEKLFTFVTDDCKRQEILQHVAVNDSSWQRAAGAGAGAGDGQPADWSPNDTDPASPSVLWTPDHGGHASQPWLQLDLGEKKRITGILTTGSPSTDHYVKSYKVEYRERNRWKPYTQYNSSEPLVFEGNVDSHQQTRGSFQPAIVARHLRLLPQAWNQQVAMRVELLGCPYVRSIPPAVTLIVSENAVNSSSQVTLETLPTRPESAGGDQESTEPLPISPLIDFVQLVIVIVVVAVLVLMLPVCFCVYKALQKKKTKESGYGASDAQHTGCWKQIKQPFARHQSTEFTISYSSEKEPIQKLDLVTSAMAAEYQQPLMIGTGTVSRKGSTFRPMDTEAKEDSSDAPSHYDFLSTANQYALPLTNQEPEYATPIIERHAFRKEAFVPDQSYNVPGVVLNKTPSFKATENGVCRKGGASHSGGYQTPQAKVDRPNPSEGVYDSPKVRRPAATSAAVSNYQRPQGKASVLECYSSPRDCVRLGQPPSSHWPDAEGSSDPSTQSGTN
ncbi:discoidin, CUB and LCCL domain-containing protein 1 isoform X1 [Clupea harengus]|uniref:Discoidin, CUB and LCCL domain-containing protein 1 isoform X1 n=1 Tax=Clupea harengus TaxID=7950 RepID=A0A6P8GCL5_CLUHA|nr:discoidin, CUB and LCCL domain-containing protein 1 isoform X1 [Clupea harengus]